MARKFVQGLAFVGVVTGLGALGGGCLDRPVTAQAPTIKMNFTAAVNQNGIDKVDLLFDIDNSASMGDKQLYFQQAIPQMVARLVTPRCIDDNTGQPTGKDADPATGQCSNGSVPEFTAVHDMHVGVVTSSLGPRLGDACASTANVTSAPSSGSVSAPPFNDDKGELINRSGAFGSGSAIGDATLPEGGGFLYWYPALGNTKPAVTPPTALTTIGDTSTTGTLVGDFAELVGAAGESGCGIESQLESWYRFLIQPDPYKILVNNSGVAEWSGVDTTIIQQRHDFLRPDSLVAVIVLSDENDSEIDVRSYRGTGYMFMQQSWDPPRGTTACQTDPTGSACITCGTGACTSAGTACTGDTNCKAGNYTSDTDWGYNLNLRHVHMQQKYALNPQFPMERYYIGLTSLSVPNRLGEYPNPNSSYDIGNNNCTNPLFASKLPQASDVPDDTVVSPTEIGTTLCKLPTGAIRTASDVFYADIGGVPHELLQSTPGGSDGLCGSNIAQADCPQKDTLSSSDWVKILGQGPASYAPPSFPVSYDYTNIDPHMIESETPRSGLAGPALGTGSDPVRPDPTSGREWTTQTGTHSNPVDLEFACIFKLPIAQQRDCSAIGGNTIEGNSCDCVPGSKDSTNPWSSGGPATTTGNSNDQISPLCSKTTTDGKTTSSVGDYTVQTYAKAYPTTRQLMLANMMGTQGIVSSLCPIHTEDNSAADDPLYGYRPAVNAIVNRLKSALQAQCVPKLTPDPNTGLVPCLVLVSFPQGVGPSSATGCASYGGGAYEQVTDPNVLTEFNAQQHAIAGDGGTSVDLSKDVTCELIQVKVAAGQSCTGGASPGWCYVTDTGSGASCPQEIAYSSTGVVPNGAVINLQCIAQNTGSSGSGSGS